MSLISDTGIRLPPWKNLYEMCAEMMRLSLRGLLSSKAKSIVPVEYPKVQLQFLIEIGASAPVGPLTSISFFEMTGYVMVGRMCLKPNFEKNLAIGINNIGRPPGGANLPITEVPGLQSVRIGKGLM